MKRSLLLLSFFGMLLTVKAVTVADAGADMKACLGNSSEVITAGSAPGSGEKAYWLDLDGISQEGRDTIFDTSIEVVISSRETYHLVYQITDGNEISSDTMLITGIDIPDITNAEIVMPDGCTNEIVSVVPTGGVDVETWSFKAISGLEIHEVASDWLSAEFRMLGDLPYGEIEVVANNRCGSSIPETIVNNVNLLPGSLTLNGPMSICQTQELTYAVSGEADSYQWRVNGQSVLPSNVEGTEFLLRGMDYLELSSVTISVTGSNVCGDGVEVSMPVEVQVPEALGGMLNSDRVNNSFCDGDGNIEFTMTPFTSIIGAVFDYTFTVSGVGQVQSPSNDNTYTAPEGQIVDGSVVTAEVTVNPAGSICFTTTTYSESLTMQLLNASSTRLSTNAIEVCELDTIKLLVADLSELDEISKWEKDGVEIAGMTDSVLVLTRAEERGFYSVFISNSVCGDTVHSQEVMLFEQPVIQPFSFVDEDTLLTLYTPDANTGIDEVYTVTVEGLELDKGNTDEYVWTSNYVEVLQDQPELEVSYQGESSLTDTLTLVVTNELCSDSATLYLKYELPDGLGDAEFTSNAVYPNPVTTNQPVNVAEEFVNSELEVYSIQGGLLWKGEASATFDFSPYTGNTFLMRFVNAEGVYVTKVVVE